MKYGKTEAKAALGLVGLMHRTRCKPIYAFDACEMSLVLRLGANNVKTTFPTSKTGSLEFIGA